MTTLAKLPARLRLSVDELNLIARAGDLAAFPGLPAPDSEPAVDSALIDSLRAHGIVTGDDDKLELRDDVAALLGAILDGDASLELEVSSAAGAATTILHLRERLTVVQWTRDRLVSLVVVLPAELHELIAQLCGEDPARDVPTIRRSTTLSELAAIESGDRLMPEGLNGYAASVTEPARAGRAVARGTLYGEPRAACAWVAGPGGTYVLHDRSEGAEVVRAEGAQLAVELLSLLPFDRAGARG